uniref:Uncharacterized protein n=1 Tax=Aegilops tauschii TaxID=37682 RepID=N1R496_AEGTA
MNHPRGQSRLFKPLPLHAPSTIYTDTSTSAATQSRTSYKTTDSEQLTITERTIDRPRRQGRAYLRGGELGDGLGASETACLASSPGRTRRTELGGLADELLKDVVDEGVHDGHGLGGDADVRVHLLQHLEDVDLVRLHALIGLLLLLVGAALLGLRRRFSALGFFPTVVFSAAGAFSATAGFFSALGPSDAAASPVRGAVVRQRVRGGWWGIGLLVGDEMGRARRLYLCRGGVAL